MKDVFMETYTGKFYPFNPSSKDIRIEDISHALSLICRFNGQCGYFYSVAQHSINVYNELKKNGYDKNILLLGLLHDGAEAYIGDMISPIKKQLPIFKEIELKIEDAIYKAFDIKVTDDILKIIKDADNNVFYNEVPYLLHNYGNWLEGVSVKKIDIDASYHSPKEIEDKFMEIFNELTK